MGEANTARTHGTRRVPTTLKATPVNTTVLMLEDDAERLARFHTTAARLGLEIVSWPDAHRMIAEVAQLLPAAVLVSLDHDLEPTGARDPGDGLDVAKFLVGFEPMCPIIVHTSNGRGATR